MKKYLASLLALALAIAMFPATSPSVFAESMEVNVYNWYDYMDESVYDLFEQETGIHVNKMYFKDNEAMMVQLRHTPGAYDLVFPSDYCVERMIKEGLLAEINFDNIPNFENVDPAQRNAGYDPEQKYTVPYMWGTVGILYNTTMVDDPVDSWGILWNEKYANNIFMQDSIRDSFGITLKYLGYPISTLDPKEIAAAGAALKAQKPLVKAYYLDETKEAMIAGEAALSVMYSGDAYYAIYRNPDLAYVVPKEGSNVWIDPMVIPATAKNKENAEKLIDFLCRPEIAQMNCEEIWYSSPNRAAIELMGEEYTENEVINPSQEVLDRCEFFHDIPDNIMKIYSNLWGQVVNAK